MPIGQFLRIRRNCFDEVTYRLEAEDLYRRFRNRGYIHKTIRWAQKRASSAKRKNLIQPIEGRPLSVDTSPVCIISQYGSWWYGVRSILNTHWNVLHRSDSLSQFVGPRPLLVSRRVKNLWGNLVHLEFVRTPTTNLLSDRSHPHGIFPCWHWYICQFAECTSSFTDADAQKNVNHKAVYQLQYLKGVLHPWVSLLKALCGKDQASVAHSHQWESC